MFKKILKTLFLIDLIRGLILTFKYLFRRKITIQYPEEKTPLSNRFRGLHALMRYENGEERCIACKLCESVCPSLAISIDSEIGNNNIRRAKSYNIDLTKCIFCGFCEESCPVGAIVETNILEYYGESKNDLYLTKDILLDIGNKYKKNILLNKLLDSKYR